MTNRLLSLQLLCAVLASAAAEPAPAPGRVPKVYNALITSNQNLEPSKAYPVYQPVIHDPFAYPFQPAIFYGDYPISNTLNPSAVLPPNQPAAPTLPPTASQPSPPPLEGSQPEPQADPSQQGDGSSTPAPPAPPSTQSPIPLNEFGLPSQVVPLGRFDPAFNGFTQLRPFTYQYPGLRFYDPYDPFSLSPYANLPPLYRPLPSVFSQGPVAPTGRQPPSLAPAPESPAPPPPEPQPDQPSDNQTPPPEPSDLNAFNYSSNDPSIPNVPPPPLPEGGLKDDKSE